MPVQPPVTLGLIPAHRGAFNQQLATAMRQQVLEAMRRAGYSVVAPTAEQTKGGCVQDRREAELCGELFRREPWGASSSPPAISATSSRRRRPSIAPA